MQCFVGDKKIRLNPYNMKYSSEISKIKGTTSDVYLIDEKAYKLYRLPYLKESLTKELIETMKSLKTKRIITPENAIFNKKHIVIGTVSPYIKDLGEKNLLTLNKKQFISEIKFLQEDFILLGEKKIKVVDLFLRNFVFNNGIYFIDVGKFKFLSADENIVISINLDELNTFIIERFLLPLISIYSNNKMQSSNKLKEDYYGSLRKSIPITEIIDRDFTENTLEKYLIKRASLK